MPWRALYTLHAFQEGLVFLPLLTVALGDGPWRLSIVILNQHHPLPVPPSILQEQIEDGEILLGMGLACRNHVRTIFTTYS